MELKDKVAIVTGGASGIGRATAVRMAAEGARLVVADMNEALGEAVAADIRKAGGKAVFRRVDVRRDEDCAAMVATALEQFGRLDIAFNNAGISGSTALTEDLGLELWQRVIDVNLTGVFNCLVHELRAMKETGGAIVNTASIAGLMGTPGSSAYCASKHGVIGLTRTAAMEYGKYNIRINALCPGYVSTPMTEGPSTEFPARTLEKAIAMTPLRRMGAPAELAEMVVWLCSDKASFATGGHFTVDGGVMA